MLNPLRTIGVAGIPFEVSDLGTATEWVVRTAAAREGQGIAVRLGNAYCVALSSRDERYRRLLTEQGRNFPDGIPVVAAMRVLGYDDRAPGRVRGPSLFREALGLGVALGVRHGFLGTTPETLRLLQQAALEVHPGLQVAGIWAPPFRDLDQPLLDAIVARVAEWRADVVWVGMGSPKQDFVAQEVADRLGVIAVGVGAAFDFAAGTVREAPVWVQQHGLEWAYRLAKEPRRLWRRYVFGNGRFLALVLRQLADERFRYLLDRARSGSARTTRARDHDRIEG